MKKEIKTDKAPGAIGPYVQGVEFGNLVFASGQCPFDPVSGATVEGGVAEQAKMAMENLKAVLEQGGASMDTVLKTTCLLSDMANFQAFNEVYASYFGESFPARTCFAARELPKGILVEVEAIAYKK